MNEYENVLPRYEFRTFAKSLDSKLIDKVRNEFPCDGFRQSREVYIMSHLNHVNNTKLRDNKMDIKCFVKEVEGFEQWNPLAKFKFPLSKDRIQKELFPAFGVTYPELKRKEYTQEEFLNEIIHPHAQLTGVDVLKRRFGTTICECIAEYAEVEFNGAPFVTISIESTNISDLNAARDLLGLDRYENINYLKAIKRLIGQHMEV